MVYSKRRFTKIVKTNIGTLTFVQGYFKAKNICLNEVSINNKVLRITLGEHREKKRKVLNGQNKPIKKTRILKRKRRESVKVQENNEKPKRRKVFKVAEKQKSSHKNSRFLNFINMHKTSQPKVYTNKTRKYCLKFEVPLEPIFPQLNFSFEVLVESVKRMRLPIGWIVKYVVHKGVIVFVCITNNNKERERSVTFGSGNHYYKIVIDSKTVNLLASPTTIDNIADLEVLANIIQDINSEDCMVNGITFL